MDHYLSFKLFLKISKLINESNALSFVQFGVYLPSKKTKKIKDFI